jgi:plasmid stabilization system protein ParE
VPRIQLAGAAWRDLEDLLDYLRARNPDAARRVGLAITGKIDLLRQFPEIGRLVDRRGEADYRATVVGSYLIWYRLDPQHGVIVLGIRHGRRRQPTVEDLDPSAE